MSRLLNSSIKQVKLPFIIPKCSLNKNPLQIIKNYREKSICPKTLTSKSEFAKIKTFNKKYNAFVTLTEEQAAKKAEESAQRLISGNPRPLEGVFVAVKDNFCTKDVSTTCASK